MVIGFNCFVSVTMVKHLSRCLSVYISMYKNMESGVASLSIYRDTQSLFQSLHNGGTYAKASNVFLRSMVCHCDPLAQRAKEIFRCMNSKISNKNSEVMLSIWHCCNHCWNTLSISGAYASNSMSNN